MTHITEENFPAEVLQSDIPVIVDFHAEWCQPCRALAPMLQKYADDNEGKVKVVKLDIETNQSLTQEYRIKTIPTLVVFKNGEVTNKHTGLLTRAELDKLVA